MIASQRASDCLLLSVCKAKGQRLYVPRRSPRFGQQPVSLVVVDDPVLIGIELQWSLQVQRDVRGVARNVGVLGNLRSVQQDN